jgi:hypothetical protein
VNNFGEPDGEYVPWGGAITFRPTVSWNFSAAAPSSTQYDFYTAALQQLARVFGVGISGVWMDKMQMGTPWKFTGVNAKAANNNVTVPLDDRLDALRSSLTSTVNGKSQPVLIMTMLGKGLRRELTKLDYAVLSDLGWDVPASAAQTTASADALPYHAPPPYGATMVAATAATLTAATSPKRELIDELA